MAELQQTLNTLAGTTGLDAQGAANVWAGTTGKDLVSALNIKNGTVGKDLQGVLNALAGTTGKGVNGAASSLLVRNLLTANQASVETDNTGFYNNAPANGTITRSVVTAQNGTGSALMTSLAAGAISFRTGDSAVANNGKAAVVGGANYTAVWSGKGTAKSVLPRIYWYTAAGAACSTPHTLGTAVTTNASTWTQATVLAAVAPADAAYAAVGASWTAAAAAEAIYFDSFGLWQGVGGTWALPGQIILGVNANI